LNQIGELHWIGADQRRSRRDDRCVLATNIQLDECIADDAIGLDGGHRVGPYELPQILPHPHPHVKPFGRPGRYLNLENFTRVESCESDPRSHLKSRHLAKRGVQLELFREQQPAVADQKEAPGKQHETQEDESPHPRTTRSRHDRSLRPRSAVIPPPALA
jgi:hypothetical protein